jgi:hypothetical protein
MPAARLPILIYAITGTLSRLVGVLFVLESLTAPYTRSKGKKKALCEEFS